ncbi:MAG: hypothetical protein RLZZ399_1784 [Verrucomicrobiota bacterium]
MKSLRYLPLMVALAASALPVFAQTAAKPATEPAPIVLPVQPAHVAAPKLDPQTGEPHAGFLRAHDSFVAIARDGLARLVFLGDSITAGWGGQRAIWEKAFGAYQPANFGIGGDRTQHVLWRVENGEFDGIKPKVVVLMIGTNNSGVVANSPEEVAAGIRNIIDAIHKRTPETQVLLLGIFPRGETAANNPGREKNNRVNEIIAKYHDGKKVHFLDIGSKFLEADGRLSREMMPDLLHLNAKSYQIWADAIAPTLEKLMR